ncbi:MAG: hypothetical protein ACW976_02125 [Candidatus Ranarchaeia archaeon]|jgi:hypothetical protein
MMVKNQKENLQKSLTKIKEVLESLNQILSEDQREKMKTTLTGLLEEHIQSPQLTLIQVMKIHQRSRKDKQKHLSTVLYNLLLVSNFYLQQEDIGRLTYTLLDVGDMLVSGSHMKEALLVFEKLFSLVHHLDPKPWVRELLALSLLMAVSVTLPDGDIRATKEHMRNLLSTLNPSQVDRLRREDVYKIMRSFIDTLRTHDQIHLHRLRKRQTRSLKRKASRVSETIPLISLQDILEELKTTYNTISRVYSFLRNL